MGARTWERKPPDAWRPLFTSRLACGCWTDDWTGQVREPCVAHESEGHVSVVSPDQDGVAVARCLVRECRWQESRATEGWAVEAAQRHWADTRVAGVADT